MSWRDHKCISSTCSSLILGADQEEPYPSLSDFHDYEPNLEFDDTELTASVANGKSLLSFR